MKNNTPLLEKKAINAALSENWTEAINLNKDILERTPNDVKATLRLGKAYLQVKNFNAATECFEIALQLDPINAVAKKNLEASKAKKVQAAVNTKKVLLKHPGTTVECLIEIKKRGLQAENLPYGLELGHKIFKSRIDILHNNEVIGEITDTSILKGVNKAKAEGATFSCSFLKGEGKKARLLCESNLSIFKSDKQDIKPYMRKGAIEEPELEVESYDDETEE